jgi:hypothetical protein
MKDLSESQLKNFDKRELSQKIDDRHKNEHLSKLESGERKDSGFSLPLYKTEIYTNSNFKYTKEIDDILVKRFSQFGLYKDFETLMRVATKFYNENDEITTFDYLLQKNKILREIMLGKMDYHVSLDATLRYQLEAAMISLTYEEIDKRIHVSLNFILKENISLMYII